MPGYADSDDGYRRLHIATANIVAEPHQKQLTQSRHRSTNPIARGRISGFVQSGFNEIAHSARRAFIAARSHRSLQIPSIANSDDKSESLIPFKLVEASD
jgi:ribosomal protein L11 methylase PrmA